MEVGLSKLHIRAAGDRGRLTMDLNITFEPDLAEPSGSRLVLAVGDTLIRSYPMGPEDHYRNLFALKHFLGLRTLTHIVFGDEPVGEVEFLGDGDLAVLKPYKRPEKTNSFAEFNLIQALSRIDHILYDLLLIIPTDRDSIERQIKEDIDAGVYD
jgi:hypothetical protein